MNTLNEKRLAFLTEGVAYYAENPKRRSKDVNEKGEPICFYDARNCPDAEDSEGCFIGRKLTPELRAKLDEEFTLNLSVYAGVGVIEIFEQLPEDLKELEISFLGACQALHDTDRYWTETGLSEEGLKRVEQIKEEYYLNS